MVATLVDRYVYVFRRSDGRVIDRADGDLSNALAHLRAYLTAHPHESPRDVVIIEQTSWTDGRLVNRFLYHHEGDGLGSRVDPEELVRELRRDLESR